MNRRTLVTAGPSIEADAVRAIVPTAEVVAPIRFADTYQYGLRPGDTLVVVDGLFWQSASVRHRELLDLIHDGIDVYGCSSMGALRAAELTDFGMVGYGDVFDAYRTGTIDGDDEVGMVHGLAEDDYAVGVDALVNIRATLAAGVADGLLAADQAAAVVAAAKGRCFTDRAWSPLLHHADLDPACRTEFLRWVRTRPVDVKRDDAERLLRLLATGHRRADIAAAAVNSPGTRPAPGRSGYTSAWSWNMTPRHATEHGLASDGDALTMAALVFTDFPQWRHEKMLRVLAAGELAEAAPPPAGPADPACPDRPDGVSEESWQAWLAREQTLTRHLGTNPDRRTLKTYAVQALCRTGVLPDPASPLPDPVERAWVLPTEAGLPVLTRHALLATRSAATTRSATLDRTLLVDLAQEGRLTDAAGQAARVRATFAARVPEYTGSLSAKGRQVVNGLIADRWGTGVVDGLRERGLRELPELATMLALVG